jgi:hypothetical protein
VVCAGLDRSCGGLSRDGCVVDGCLAKVTAGQRALYVVGLPGKAAWQKEWRVIISWLAMDGGLLSTYPLSWFLQQDFGLGQSRSPLSRAPNRRGIGFWERPIYRTQKKRRRSLYRNKISTAVKRLRGLCHLCATRFWIRPIPKGWDIAPASKFGGGGKRSALLRD